MEQLEGTETVEIDPERFVALEFTRRWPKYVVTWSVRLRSRGAEFGESDFPIAEGEVEQLPSQGTSVDEVHESLRAAALEQAMKAAESQTEAAGAPKGRSFLDRLLGRG